MTATIRGTLGAVRFSGRELFTIAAFSVAGTDEQTTVAGRLVSVQPGDSLELTGRWETHPKYGRQFKVKSHKTITPESAEGVVAWLTTLPRLGRATAIKMVEQFGPSQVFGVLADEPQRLTELPGITPARSLEIQKAYLAKQGEAEAMTTLRRYLTEGQAAKVVDRYGLSGAVAALQQPYRLAEISGFGWKTVDAIGQRMGVEKDHIERARAAVLHWLDEAKTFGHCFVPLASLKRKCGEFQISGRKVQLAVEQLRDEDKLTGNEAGVYLPKLHRSERVVASRIRDILKRPQRSVGDAPGGNGATGNELTHDEVPRAVGGAL